MSWELIHRLLLHPYESVMKLMCHNQTLYVLPKHCTNKIQKSCTIYYTAKMTTISKVTTVDTSNIQPGELVHMDFSSYNVTSICGFTSIIAVFCAKTRMIWIFQTAPKRAPVRIICFILTTLMNEHHPYKRVRVDEDIALSNSTDVTNLLVDEFKNIHVNYWWWCILAQCK